jgi:hypothetical protein
MTAERVVVAKAEMRTILEHITAIQATIQAILERPDPQPIQHDDKGWPLLGEEDES